MSIAENIAWRMKKHVEALENEFGKEIVDKKPVFVAHSNAS